jgi:hypothetical protein
MQTEFVIPRVKHAEESNFCAEVPGIASDFEKLNNRKRDSQRLMDVLTTPAWRGLE